MTLCKRQMNVSRPQIQTIKITIIRSTIWCESITSLRCGPFIMSLMQLVLMDSGLSRQEQAIIITIPFLPLMPAFGEFVLNEHHCRSRKQRLFWSLSIKKTLDTCDVFTIAKCVWIKQNVNSHIQSVNHFNAASLSNQHKDLSLKMFHKKSDNMLHKIFYRFSNQCQSTNKDFFLT